MTLTELQLNLSSMSHNKQYLGLDIGEVRIGVATADDVVRIAVPYDTIAMDEATFRKDIVDLVVANNITTVVIGYPRNQSGEPTAQTAYVEQQASELADIDAEVVFQDESLTSVMAEERLKSRSQAYDKAAIDAEAAAIILQDYLER
jgi:putative Holliday junction resolvase